MAVSKALAGRAVSNIAPTTRGVFAQPVDGATAA